MPKSFFIVVHLQCLIPYNHSKNETFIQEEGYTNTIFKTNIYKTQITILIFLIRIITYFRYQGNNNGIDPLYPTWR